jgi:hypothetical protein
MTNEKSQKVAKKYECKRCNYICVKKSDYIKHVATAKHKRLKNANEMSPKIATSYCCECGKTYKHQSSLCKHKKNCYIINTENNRIIQTNDNSTILNLISQNKELMNMLVVQKEETKELIEQNKKMQQTIQEIVPKIGNNNTTNNTNNNQFNLNVFLNEDCKDAINFSEFIENIKITFEDLEHQAQVGYINGVSKLFIENLRDLGTHKRPIHCTDKKRKTIYIKENNEWDKEGSQDTLKKGIREVSRKGFECLMKEKEENQEEYKDIESDFTQKCLSIHRNILPSVPQKTTISKVIEKITTETGIK